MDIEIIEQIYAVLIHLYPRRFQDEFGEEMQHVFAQSIKEAQLSGWRSVWVLIWREIRDTPIAAIRERWRARGLPPYVSPNESQPDEKPVQQWIAISFFIIPALLTLVDVLLPDGALLVLGPLLVGIILFSIIAGFIKGMPRWTLPSMGAFAGFLTILAYQEANTLLQPWIAPSYRLIVGDESLVSRLMWQFIQTGEFILCLLFLSFVIIGALALLDPNRSPIRSLKEDWTRLSFLFYGATAIIVLVDFDDYHHEEWAQIAIFIILACGAWGYLYSFNTFGRIASLLSAFTIAMGILGISKWLLAPSQEWWFANNPSTTDRWFAVLDTSCIWFWMMLILIGPGLRKRKPPNIVLNLILLIVWIFLFRPIFPYLSIIFTRQEFRLNQLALLGVIGLIIYQARRGGMQARFGSAPMLYPPALVMLLGSSIAFVLAERLVDINTFSASLFGLAFYGLLGLWLNPTTWRQGLPASLLLIATLPFNEHLQTFVGYPLRLFTATLVRDGLTAFGVPSIGIDTILVFENGISQVDIPCSGVKSLWTGGMFLLAATWIERRRIGKRWGLVSLTYAFMLIAANLARVAILVTVGEVIHWRLLAEMLHVPLGVLGFVAACVALVWMLRRFVPETVSENIEASRSDEQSKLRHPNWLTPALLFSILALILLYSPRPQVAAAQSNQQMIFSQEANVEPWPLSPGELNWLSADGPLAASRWRFDWHGHRGSLLLITSDTWRAHHRPERCFETYGLTVDRSYSSLINSDFPLRLVSLSAGQKRFRYTAVYWLQTQDRITDDYSTRIWSDLTPERQTWVLVTVLFDKAEEPLDGDMQAFYLELRQAVERSLQGGSGQ